jgi:hypothetical protein
MYNSEFPSPKDDLCEVCNWPAGSGEDFSKILNIFLFFGYMYYLPLGKGVVLHLYNFRSPVHKDNLCLHWLKMA